MNDDNKLRTEYEICQRRGHQPSEYRTATNPPMSRCKWCRTLYYWTQPELVEHQIPHKRTGPNHE